MPVASSLNDMWARAPRLEVPDLPLQASRSPQPDPVHYVGELKDETDSPADLRLYDSALSLTPPREEPRVATADDVVAISFFVVRVQGCTLTLANRWLYNWQRYIPLASGGYGPPSPGDPANESDATYITHPNSGRAMNLVETTHTTTRAVHCTEIVDPSQLDEWVATVKPIPIGDLVLLAKDPLANPSPQLYVFSFVAENAIDFECCDAPGDCPPTPTPGCNCT